MARKCLSLLLLSVYLLCCQCSAKHSDSQSHVDKTEKRELRDHQVSDKNYHKALRALRHGTISKDASERILDVLFNRLSSPKTKDSEGRQSETPCLSRSTPLSRRNKVQKLSTQRRINRHHSKPMTPRHSFQNHLLARTENNGSISIPRIVLPDVPSPEAPDSPKQPVLQLPTPHVLKPPVLDIPKLSVPDSPKPPAVPDSDIGDAARHLAGMKMKVSTGWMVLDNKGGQYISKMSEIDEVYKLANKDDLAFTYNDYQGKKDQFTSSQGKWDPDVVLKSKTRVKVTSEELKQQPYSSIGRISDAGTGCTGTFIGPKHILMAAHCLIDKKDEGWYNSYDFQLHKDCDPDNGILYEWEKAVIPLGYLEQKSVWVYDYAVIVVKTETPEHTVMNFGWKDVQIRDGSEFIPVFHVGYPNVPDKCMWRDHCRRRETGERILETTCDIIEGDSGSPVFFPSANPVITCIHSYAKFAKDSNDIIGRYCVRITKLIFASLVLWIEKY